MYKKVYQPRIEFASNDGKKPQSLGASPSAWIWQAFRQSEMNMTEQLGMDSIMFLRIILTFFKFFAGALIVAIPLMIFNFYSPEITQNSGYDQYSIRNVTKASLPLLTMQNLASGSNYYYMYSFITLIGSCYAYLLFYWTWQDYIALRKMYIKSPEYLESPHSRTLLLSGVSRKILQQEEIVNLVLEIFPHAQIDQIVYGRDYKSLPLHCQKHSDLSHKMEKLLDKCKHSII